MMRTRSRKLTTGSDVCPGGGSTTSVNSDRAHAKEVALGVAKHHECVLWVVTVTYMCRTEVEHASTFGVAVSRGAVHVDVHLVPVRHRVVGDLQCDVAVCTSEDAKRVGRSRVHLEAEHRTPEGRHA